MDETVIQWTERCEMHRGIPSVMIAAQAHGRMLSLRYDPKAADVVDAKEGFVGLCRSLFVVPDINGKPGWTSLEPGWDYAFWLVRRGHGAYQPRNPNSKYWYNS